ncbi:unnamed protein product [Victoria cruziana]
MARPAALAVAVIVVVVAVLAAGAEGGYTVYNTTAGIVAGKLNVHLVPHSHDDVGWLKTIDQYFVGTNNSIQGACVENVLDSVFSALLADKNRKFVFAEQAFFQRWWRKQSPKVQKIMKRLVSAGRLEFINGGMCMHDEAAAHYIDMIDQTTLGHRFIKDEFGQLPRIGWQIDPFGHSAVQAYLLSAEVGFDSLFFARIDYQDRQRRRHHKNLEFVWQGSKTFRSSSQVFTGVFPNGNYEPPENFYFEVNDNSPIVQDDVSLFDYNVHERVEDFVNAAISQANVTRTNHIMWTMGTDFKYQYANTWFRQMDKLIHYVNQDGRVNALYSTPSLYTDAKHATDELWPLKTDDFFPYADQANAYWTGYFTSRPASKRYVRVMSAYYLAARQLEFLKGRSNSRPNTDSLADAIAINQHHDGITGTEKQHVANDYNKRLSIGYSEAEEVVNVALACITEGKSNTSCKNVKLKFEQCPLLNISYCPLSEGNLKKKLVVVVYNSLGWKRADVIQIPISSKSIIVRDSDGTAVKSQIWPPSSASVAMRNFHVRAYTGAPPSSAPRFWLAFAVSVPPLGFSTYTIENASGKSSDEEGNISTLSTAFLHQHTDDIEIGQGNLKLIYSANGKLSRLSNKKSLMPVTVVHGPILEEVHQEFSPWIHQLNLGMYVMDNNLEMSVLVDRATGGSSIADGEMELMLHRRLLHDDSRGVGEPLNETVCIREACEGLVEGDELRTPVPTFSATDSSYSLPDNVAVITLEELKDGSVLLRLAHLYELGEDKDLSVMASVHLRKLFSNKKIKKISELSLSANQEREAMERKRLVWKVEGAHNAETVVRGGPVDPIKLVVELGPMEIRTFALVFS